MGDPSRVRPLRIAVWYHLPFGGAWRAMSGQLSRLAERGHRIEVWTPEQNVEQTEVIDGLVDRHYVPLAWEPHRARPLLDRWFELLERKQATIRAVRAHAQTCGQEIAAGNFDLLFAHPCMHFSASAIGSAVDGLPRMLYLQEPTRLVHEACPRNVWVQPPLPPRQPLKKRIGHWLRDQAEMSTNRAHLTAEIGWANAYDRILVNSLYSRECVLRAYGLEAYYCPLGIEEKFFAAPRQSKEPYVMGVGTIHRIKGIDRIIDALACIPQERRPRLVWSGNFDYASTRAELEARAQARGVEATFHVMQPDEAIVDQMSRAACCVFAPRLEPFGLAPLEANAVGTAVVTLAEGGLRETVVHNVNGLITDSPEPAALGAYIDRCVSDLAYAEWLGGQARDHVRRAWSWSRGIDVLEQHLYETCHSRTAALTS